MSTYLPTKFRGLSPDLLLPNPSELPASALRYAWIDTAWREALLDGAYSVGHRTVQLEDAERPLTVSVWYPTTSAAADVAVPEAFLTGSQQTAYAALLAEANPDCASQTATLAADAAPADGGPWPAVVFSHCHSCTRFSSYGG